MKLTQDGNSNSLLFSGDMEVVEACILAVTKKDQLKSTHYNIVHHGASNLANRPVWLCAISPVEAHVSHEYSGSFHHPRCEAINNLISVGSLSTECGTPDFTCFGEKVTNYKEDSRKACHHLYSTLPTKDKICVIKLLFKEGSK